ncbi:MAG: rRNA maturation RNase YbeY [Ignavibacteriaceae bacterium]|nr:rRNA maturation RNase YbeY [Ignavibacteriaceae bacterium]
MKKGRVNISFQKKLTIGATDIRKIVRKMQNLLGFDLEELTLSFILDKSIHEINREYLKHDYPTDIITFDYSDKDKIFVDGEILISFETAAVNAKKFNVTLENEITRLVIHGVLHLLGYDDKTPSKKKIMKNKENSLLMQVLNSENKF